MAEKMLTHPKLAVNNLATKEKSFKLRAETSLSQGLYITHQFTYVLREYRVPMVRQRVELDPENAAVVNELVTLGLFKTPTTAANYLLSKVGERALHRLRKKLRRRLLERDERKAL